MFWVDFINVGEGGEIWTIDVFILALELDVGDVA